MAFYSASKYEQFLALNRAFGPYAPFYWALLFCNVLTPQVLWLKRMRQNVWVLFAVAIVVNIGMWLERFVIVMSLHRDYMPSAWGMYSPTIWDWATFIGTLGLFMALLFLFIRFLPVISIFEMRTLVPEPEAGHGAAPPAEKGPHSATASSEG